MNSANDEAAYGGPQDDAACGESIHSAYEMECPDEVDESVEDDAILNISTEELVAQREARVESRRSKVTDEVERAEVLLDLMYQLSEECLNLARYEDEPTKRSALIRSGLSSATGWVKMSDLRDKVRARKTTERR